MKTRIALALCTSLALAACSSTPAADSDAASSDATSSAEAPASADASTTPEGLTVTCNVDPAKAFKGQKATDNLAEQARAAAGAASVRVIRPNQPVTMDYRGDRLNVITDDADMITEVNCG
ncbi:MAG: hypothetical protein HOQ01_04720 [Lysobacter sp.]|nr:hypothetical protein [Lysobacter sp.]